ncbi:MAG: hypothetical protein ACOYUK_02245 [Patescibacteria group bacterium]
MSHEISVQTPFQRYRWLVIAITVGGALAALVFALITPVQYDTSLAFFINRTNTQVTTEYQYDGYYAIQASDLFAQTVMSWFLTPSVLLDIYGQAGIDPAISSIEELTSRFKTRQYSPQNIVVRYQERDRDTAQKIAIAITDVVEKKGADANKNIEQEALFDVQGGVPVVVEKRPSIVLNAGIGLVAGFILSVVLAYSLDYLRRPAQPKQTQLP